MTTLGVDQDRYKFEGWVYLINPIYVINYETEAKIRRIEWMYCFSQLRSMHELAANYI